MHGNTPGLPSKAAPPPLVPPPPASPPRLSDGTKRNKRNLTTQTTYLLATPLPLIEPQARVLQPALRLPLKIPPLLPSLPHHKLFLTN